MNRKISEIEKKIPLPINGGKWKNREKLSKFDQKLHEFEKIRTIFCTVENFFSKIVNWGGRNKLKCLEKNPNFTSFSGEAEDIYI